MNREEALRAVEVLAASPASRWIGNKVVDGWWVQKCTRCGAEESLELPSNVRGPEDVPAGFDERLFAWKRAFQVAHEGCVEAPPGQESSAGTRPLVEDVTFKRLLSCARHGPRRWQGHVMCDACGRSYQTTDDRRPGHAPEICRCGKRLMPPAADRVGDALGLQTCGIAIDAEGRRYQTSEAEDWTARPICYLCYRYFAKHHGGRVPVEADRN